MTSPSVLERRLGPLDAAAIIVANVIGGGILFTPPQVAALVPHAGLFLLVWVAGGALAFAGAMAYAELATARPRAGGEYVYLNAAFGPSAAFLTGWTSFVAGFSGAIATSAVVMVFYLGRFLPRVADEAPWLVVTVVPGVVALTLSPLTLTAVSIIAATAALHVRGVGPGRIVMNALTILKVTALVGFIALGLSVGARSVPRLTDPVTVVPAGWLLALIPVMFTYSGWNAAAYVAEEIRDPNRNVSRALALGAGAVVAIYLLLNVVYLVVIPVGELAHIDGSVLDVIADRMLGATAGAVMGAVSIVSLAASISAMTFAGPRVYFAMARDGLFFASAARVHARYRTPAAAIVAQAVWSAVLVLTATAQALVTYTGFAIVLFSGVAIVALFVLRRREASVRPSFSAWGYPVAPALYVGVSALILLNGLYRTPLQTGAGVAIIAAGLPVYAARRWWTRRASAAQQE